MKLPDFVAVGKKIILTMTLLVVVNGFLYPEKTESKKEETKNEDNTTVITINNASQTSYKKSEETGNDTIMLNGEVSISVKKGNVTSEITADLVTYDRKTEMLYAEGNVLIATTGAASGNDTSTANSFLLNTSTLEGVFDGGKVVQTQSDAINLPSGSTLIVFSDMFGKGASNAIAFKNSSLTFCDDINPHWHIDATRTWLLPGGEFAFFNALLYVGEIPVLYLPAFYYPKDELIFNPVFGFRRREGYFIENTVYLYGRKPLDTSTSTSSSSSSSSSTSSSSSSSSTDSTEENKTSAGADALKGLYNFMKPSQLKEQRLEGLILHNLDENYTGNTSNYFKFMLDWYSTLGTMTGFSGVFKPSDKYLTSLNTDFSMGFSKAIFKDGNKYYPYSLKTGETYSDKSNFIGLELPFRYGGKINLTVSNPVNLTVDMPFFSDPYYQYDFITNRTEYMDWISYLLDSNTIANATDTITVAEYSSYTWSLTSSKSFTVPGALKKYFSTLSYNLTSSVQFSTINISTASDMKITETSELNNIIDDTSYFKKFYAPSQITPLSLSFNIAGTLFQFPSDTSVSSSSKTPQYAITMNKTEELKSIADLKADEEKRLKKAEEEKGEDEKKNEKTESEKKTEEEKEEKEENPYFNNGNIIPVLPELDFTQEKAALAEGFVYKLDYSFTPSILTQMAYSTDTSYLKTGSDFKWENIKSSMYTIKLPTTLSNNFTYGGTVFTVTNSYTYSPVYQKHPYINTNGAAEGGYTESEAATLKITDYKAESQDIATTNAVTLFPLAQVPLFCETGLKWNSTAKLYRQEFIGDADTPEYKYYTLDWGDENCITVNSLDYILGLTEMDKKFKQTLTFTQVMPPLLKQYNATLSLVFPYVTETISTGIQEKTHDDVDWDEKWTKKDLQQSTTISGKVLGSTLSISESYNYNLQEYYHSSLKLSASWYGFSTSYVASYTQGYDFENKKWVARKDKDGKDEKEFLPYSFSFAYTMPSKTFYKWFNRISVAPGLTTSLTADLIKPTSSYFIFTPSLTFNINNFFYIKFSSTSQNSVIYRYFQNLFNADAKIDGEDNVWQDLMDSFRFDDERKRQNSGFKLKSLNMEVTHDLHDWKFSMTMSFSPRLITENTLTPYYDFNPMVTIGVVWKPMESMKTQIKDNYGDWTFQ